MLTCVASQREIFRPDFWLCGAAFGTLAANGGLAPAIARTPLLLQLLGALLCHALLLIEHVAILRQALLVLANQRILLLGVPALRLAFC